MIDILASQCAADRARAESVRASAESSMSDDGRSSLAALRRKSAELKCEFDEFVQRVHGEFIIRFGSRGIVWAISIYDFDTRQHSEIVPERAATSLPPQLFVIASANAASGADLASAEQIAKCALRPETAAEPVWTLS